MRKKKDISYMFVNEYIYNWTVKYTDGTSKVFNLDTMTPNLINKTWRKVDTSDPKIYTLFPCN